MDRRKPSGGTMPFCTGDRQRIPIHAHVECVDGQVVERSDVVLFVRQERGGVGHYVHRVGGGWLGRGRFHGDAGVPGGRGEGITFPACQDHAVERDSVDAGRLAREGESGYVAIAGEGWLGTHS